MKKEYVVDINYHEHLEVERRVNRPDVSEVNTPSVNVDLDMLSGPIPIPKRFNVDVGSAHFECFFKEKKSDRLVVFLNSMFHEKEKLPRFNRWSWASISESNALYIEDPMLYKYPGLQFGWYIGTETEDYTEYLATIVKRVASKHNITKRHILFYGSSVGGSAAIICSRHIKGSTSVSINPQFLPSAPSIQERNFVEKTQMRLTDPKIKERIDILGIIHSRVCKHILIVNCVATDDFRELLHICKRFDLEPCLGLMQHENLLVWTYEAYGFPHPHASVDDQTTFLAILRLVKLISEFRSSKEIANMVEESKEFYEMFTRCWYDRFRAQKDFEKERTRSLIQSSDTKDKKTALERGLLINDWNPDDIFIKEMNFMVSAKTKLFEEIIEDCKLAGALARMYRDGRNVVQDLDKAIELMQVAAKKGAVWAKIELFDMLWKRGGENDLKEALEIASSLSLRGEGLAEGRFARAYRDGKGVKKNLDKAIELMRNSADKNIEWATVELFDMLWKRGTDKDFEEAFQLVSTPHFVRDNRIVIRLAKAYRCGRGTKKDLDKSIEIMREVTKIEGKWTNELSDILEERGAVEDIKEAYEIRMEIAEMGDVGAMGKLGRMYRDGKGVKKNLDKATEWMKKAVEKDKSWKKEFEDMLANCSKDGSMNM